MSVLRRSLLGSCTLALLLTLTSGARAGEWDQKVIATFDAPVQIPGQVLPMGTYVFKLFSSQSTRDIVQVSNADDTHLIAYVFSIPLYRPTPTDQTVFMFEERGSDSPQAIQGWFYPGRLQGHQFIYGHQEAQIASAPTSDQPSPLVSAEPQIDEPKSEAVPEASTQIAESQTAPPPAPEPPTTTSDTPAANNELPKTASTTPLIALLGMLSLGGGLGLKMLAKRVA